MKPHHLVLAAVVGLSCSSSSEGPAVVEDSTVADSNAIDSRATDSNVIDSNVIDSNTIDSNVIDSNTIDAIDAIDANDANDANDTTPDAGATCGEVSGHGCDASGGSTPPCDCEAGTVCVQGESIGCGYSVCIPIAEACDGTPSCACMGQCVCESMVGEGCATVNDVGITCNAATSRRAFKREIEYVSETEREILAKRALSIPLATYRYKTDAPEARRRLGFIIDDQPDPSFAVDDDRTHVDVYGYTSMLLATVQEQQKEIAELKKRVDALESKER